MSRPTQQGRSHGKYRGRHRARREARNAARAAAVAASAALIAGVAPGVTGSASAAPRKPARPAGELASVYQYRDGTVLVTGFVYDRNDTHRAAGACIALNTHCLRTVIADLPSPRFDHGHGIGYPHAFATRLRELPPGARITLRTAQGDHGFMDAQVANTPGDRVVNVAKRYVGGRYTYGGSSPSTGFDCSGYAMYSYKTANVADLPHNSEAQRHARGMHRISEATAQPGDLVFYMGGSSSYHVAIYAGHDMQYSASDPSEGIKYQRIWDNNVQFGTDWH